MKLKDFLDDLNVVFLSGINLGRNSSAGLTTNNYPEAIRILNMCLARLRTSFPENKHKEVFIDLQDGINFYTLDPKYAQSNTESTEPVKYIADSAENPFNYSVLNIISVYNEVGQEIPLNEAHKDDSIFLSDFKTLQVLNPVTGNTIDVVYQAGAQKLLTSGEGYLEQEIDFPDFAEYLLKLDVLTHLLQNRKTQNSENEANKYMGMYQMEFRRLLDNGYRMPNSTHSNKFRDRGWV